jgi:hypothetical protein
MTDTYPMKQVEATKARPFYSVSYQYRNVPGTFYSHHHFVPNGRTQQGTSDLATAQAQAIHLVTQPGIAFAFVHCTEDCYNHRQVFKARA